MSTMVKTHSGNRFKKNPHDFYETPLEIAVACFGRLNWVWIDNNPFGVYPDKILDIGCGTGVFGKAVKQVYPESKLTGVDIVSNVYFPDYSYDYYYVGDYLDKSILPKYDKYDLILGNPPYSSIDNSHLAEDIILHSLNLLTDNGYIGLLLKTEFTASKRRYENLFKNHAPLFEYQLVERPYWTNYKKGSMVTSVTTNTIEYSFFIWRKQENTETIKRWLSWK